jgi:hypothetical protein
MSRIFLGKPVHWLIVAGIALVMYWMGTNKVHTRDFNFFLVTLFLSTMVAVIALWLTTAKGDQVTREPFEDDAPPPRQ